MCPTLGKDVATSTVNGELRNPSEEYSVKFLPNMISIDQLQISQRQTAQLERENKRLISQLKEVIDMNRNWQRYDEQRDAYINKLHAANNELLSKLSSTKKSVSELQRQVSQEKLANSEKQFCAASSSSTGQDVGMDARMAVKEKELYTLKDEIERLNEYIASLQRSESKRRRNEEERISIFKAQIEACMDDFRQERADSEKVKTEKLRLRGRLDDAEITISALRAEVNELVAETQWLLDRPSKHTHHYANYTGAPSKPNHFYRKYLPNEQSARVGGRGWDVPDYRSTLPSDVEVDGISESLSNSSVATPEITEGETFETTTSSGAAVSLSGVSSRQGCIMEPREVLEKTLKCPQCLKEFSVEGHAKLLEHIEVCIGRKEEEPASIDDERY
ncbi:uncharacterized protein [Asterias amurensis]|uniref:uncharacterized protein n=1 Tax=Asterias amurensis TaxID=7602 RepID=UPI003AB1656C